MPRASVPSLSLAVVCSVALAGCGANATAGSSPAGTATPAEASAPACEPADLAARAATVLVVGLPGVTASTDPLAVQVAELGVGGIFLSEPNVQSAEQVTALVSGLQAAAPRPLIISTDEESGRVAVTRKIVGAGPSPRTLAAEQTPAEVQAYAAGIGKDLAALGVTLDLAPLLDLEDGPSGGVIGDRSFSADPAIAGEYGLAFSRGLVSAGVLPTVKHFPGEGRSDVDPHVSGQGVVETPIDELLPTDIAPFQQAVDAGAPVVMLNHLQYTALDPDLPATMSPKAYALLRSLGFTGVAMTDSVGMGAVNLRWDFPMAAVQAISAGADAVLATDGNQALRMRDALVAAVKDGSLPEARLDEAAARVTALGGGDPETLTCMAMTLPVLEP